MKIRKIFIPTLLVGVVFLISGCGQPKPLYYYGDYSDSYYAYKKESSAEASLELQKAIELAIQNTDESSSRRVAPGMYANLGYIYLKAGQTDKAIDSFKKEKTIYPEAAHFMDRMIKKVEVAQGDE